MAVIAVSTDSQHSSSSQGLNLVHSSKEQLCCCDCCSCVFLGWRVRRRKPARRFGCGLSNDFHMGELVQFVRKAFARRKKRVKYAAADWRPPKISGLVLASPELKEEGKK